MARISYGRIVFCAAFFLCAPWFWPESGHSESYFSDNFSRPDLVKIGNGWLEIPNENECVEASDASQRLRNRGSGDSQSEATGGGKGKREVVKSNKLFSEISQEIESVASKPQTDKSFQEATAEIKNGMVYLHCDSSQAAQMVQRVFRKMVARLTYDYTPLYAMGGMDDRALMGVRIYYLDREDRILGEIRYFYYNVEFEEFVNSGTIYSGMTKGSFDGTPRHAVVEARQILDKYLTDVNKEKIVKTRISFELSSSLCGSSAEGYLDNVSAVLADVAGSDRLTKEDILEIIHSGVEAYKNERKLFPQKWIEATTRDFGEEKIRAWLKGIPVSARNDPGKLADLVQELFGLPSDEVFVAAFVIQILVQKF